MLLSKHGEVIVYGITVMHQHFMVRQQHIQAAQTGLYMLGNIKKWVNTHYDILADFGGTSQVYGSLC